jgi:transcriptional regulator with XRE-family HTH domain
MAISSKQRAEVGQLLDAGDMTAREIAEAVGVSVSTVERLKTFKSPSKVPQNHVNKPSETRQKSSINPQKTVKNEGILIENEGDLKEKRRDSEGLLTQNEGILKEVRARLADKEGEIAFLREALNKSQEVAAAALSRAEESDRRAAIMIAATATGQISGFSGTGGSETNATAKDEQEAVSKVDNRPAEGANLRKWWQFWGKG